MRFIVGCFSASLFVITSFGEGDIADSFIRAGVKPSEYAKVTKNAATGRTHLAAYGSGFFITKDGYILTNHHVVDKAAEVVAIWKDTAYRAFVAAKSKKKDLAVLKINLFPKLCTGLYDMSNVPTVPYLLLSEGCHVGQTIFAIGFPNPQVLGYEPKVTRGIVSSLTGYEGDQGSFQMDATIAGGNSGGPVIDEYGGVVGVSVAAAHGASLGANYAVNMETVRKFMPQQVKYTTCAPGRLLRAEKLLSQTIDALVFILRFEEGGDGRALSIDPDCKEDRMRELNVRVKKAMIDARIMKLRKDWQRLKNITDWIIETSGNIDDVRELNDLARDELGLHLVIRAEADGRDVAANIKPIRGFKSDFIECGSPAQLYGGVEKRNFPVEAQLSYEDDEWSWRGELKCRYGWRGTKEIYVVLKKVGSNKKGVGK